MKQKRSALKRQVKSRDAFLSTAHHTIDTLTHDLEAVTADRDEALREIVGLKNAIRTALSAAGSSPTKRIDIARVRRVLRERLP